VPKTDALTQATKLLAGRDKTRAQLLAALLQRGYPEDEARAALERAQALGYLDDRRVADRRAREGLDDGWAGEALVARLVASGLEESQAQAAVREAIAASGWSAPEAARALVAKRKLDGAKAARDLASRGFDEDLIERLVTHP
jgi:regulatory protein